MCLQYFIKIFQTVYEVNFSVFRIWTSAKPRSIPNVIWLSHGLHHININVYAKLHHNIQLSSRDRAIVTFFRVWSSAKPQPMKNAISQSLGLDLVNINVYAKVYKNIPPNFVNITAYAKSDQTIQNGLWVIDIFHEQAGVKILTNRPVTKSNVWLS